MAPNINIFFLGNDEINVIGEKDQVMLGRDGENWETSSLTQNKFNNTLVRFAQK